MVSLIDPLNRLVCSEVQTEALQKLSMHPEKFTVWYDLCAGGIIGPYFFKDAANRNETVNGERREMISNFFLSKMQELDLHYMWFQ